MRFRQVVCNAAIIVVLQFSAASFAAQSSSLVDLGAGVTAYGVNASGQVTGCFPTTGGATHAFLYTSGEISDLGTLGGSTSCGFSVNDSGQVTGYSTTSAGVTHAFVYTSGAMQDLGSLPGVSTSVGTSINNGGTVVGYAWNGSPYALVNLFSMALSAYGTDDVVHGFEFTRGAMTELLPQSGVVFGYSAILTSAINDNGVVAGYQQSMCQLECPIAYSFVLQSGTQTFLASSPLSFAAATAINANGTVAGYGEDDAAFMHGILFIGGAMTDLGQNTEAFALNNNGQVVGISNAPRQAPVFSAIGPNARPFIYLNGVFSTLPVPGGIPTGINDSGSVIINQPALGDAYLYAQTDITLSPDSIDFGEVSVGSTNPSCSACTLTLSNKSASPISVGIVSVTGPFSQTNNCPATLASTASCTISVSFKPTALGDTMGQVVVPSDLNYASILSGTGNIALTLSSSATEAQVNAPFTLSWTATSGSSCSASGGAANDGWTGKLAAGGSMSITELTAASYTYVLTCTSGSQTIKQQVSVNVSPASKGGGGSIEKLAILILLLPLLIRMHPVIRVGHC